MSRNWKGCLQRNGNYECDQKQQFPFVLALYVCIDIVVRNCIFRIIVTEYAGAPSWQH